VQPVTFTVAENVTSSGAWPSVTLGLALQATSHTVTEWVAVQVWSSAVTVRVMV